MYPLHYITYLVTLYYKATVGLEQPWPWREKRK